MKFKQIMSFLFGSLFGGLIASTLFLVLFRKVNRPTTMDCHCTCYCTRDDTADPMKADHDDPNPGETDPNSEPRVDNQNAGETIF